MPCRRLLGRRHAALHRPEGAGLLNIGDATPIIDADDADELEELPSLLDAMIEVLPCPKPPAGYGPLMEMIGPDEIGALVPWAKQGEPYDGAVFLVKPDRLLQLVRSMDGNKLAQRLSALAAPCTPLVMALPRAMPARRPTSSGARVTSSAAVPISSASSPPGPSCA